MVLESTGVGVGVEGQDEVGARSGREDNSFWELFCLRQLNGAEESTIRKIWDVNICKPCNVNAHCILKPPKKGQSNERICPLQLCKERGGIWLLLERNQVHMQAGQKTWSMVSGVVFLLLFFVYVRLGLRDTLLLFVAGNLW